MMDKRDIVRDLVEVARDVAGQQHGVRFVLHEIVQQVEHLVPHDRVKSARRLVQNQQLRAVRERRRDGQLHFHAARIILDGLAAVDAEAVETGRELRPVPRAVGSAEQRVHLRGVHRAQKAAVLQHHADALTYRRIIRPSAEHLDLTAVRPHKVENGLDERRLSGSVFADQTHHTAARQSQIDAVQRKSFVFPGQPSDFECVFH